MTVRVVFEGLVMPNHLFIHGLRIRVREFKRKQMFCESCYKYNHTKEFCNNKPYKVNAEDKKCIHCKTDDHKTGDRKCSKRKSLEKGVEKALKASRRKTYAEMLHDLDPSAKNNNDVMDKHFPILNLGTRKSRMQFQDKKVTLMTSMIIFMRKNDDYMKYSVEMERNLLLGNLRVSKIKLMKMRMKMKLISNLLLMILTHHRF